MQRQGSPLGSADLARHRSVRRRPLSLNLQAGTLYNLPPPTQGLASLMILGLFERLGVSQAESFEHVHGLVEATRQAFQVRDTHLGDPAYMAVHATTYLSDSLLDRMAAALPRRQAQPRPVATSIGDTAWVGVIDGQGRAVSFIQSLSQAFGSGLLLAETGVLWHNHGTGFSLDEAGRNTLSPGRKPLHSLSPALARLRDGRVMVYGGMGGDVQPQRMHRGQHGAGVFRQMPAGGG
ncbi:MAG: gamma-glutamyltransferase [Rhodospirillales bacterium]|nr:gamma-glutamyltransferase [Rhodospirillales bacterium]